ncbi:penicillin-binding protein [Virgibacillus byunsanensis]|uniref:Penicillin-binding protein n=1 Tax=Virgibacillus byunsanensis TaxID=570945 RepID=A0ABW3LG99_9BACI
MNYPVAHEHVRPVSNMINHPNRDERVFPVLPFLTGLAFAPVLYGAFNRPGGYYPYPPPPPPPYYPYNYGYYPYYY